MARAWVVVALLIGCYHPNPHEGAPCTDLGRCPHPLQCDQGICRRFPIDASEAPDVEVDARTCAPIQPTLGVFAMPVRNMVLASPSLDGTPTLRPDRLEMYFKSSRMGGPGGTDLWRSTRSSVASSWSAPALVDELDTTYYEASPELSADGMTLWFVSTRPPSAGIDIWVATRASTSSPWDTPRHVPELSSPSLEEGLMVLPSQLVAYLHSDRAGGKSAIYRATRASVTEPWSAPIEVAGLTVASHQNPWLTEDECTMYFGSDRAGGQGLFDIFIATRTSPDAPFGLVTPVMELGSTAFESDPWLSQDQRYIAFTSDRPLGMGQHDVFEATR